MAANPQVSIASGATAHSTIAIPAETNPTSTSVSDHTHSSTSQSSASVASFTKVTSTTTTTTTTTNGTIQAPDAPDANPHFRPAPNSEEEHEGNRTPYGQRDKQSPGDEALTINNRRGRSWILAPPTTKAHPCSHTTLMSQRFF